MSDCFDHAGDAFDDLMRSHYADYSPATIRHRRTERPRCEHCGKGGLNWQQVKGSKWRLHDGREVHVCAPSAKGFSEVNDA